MKEEKKSTLALRKEMLAIARKEVGVVEVPKNSNTGKDVLKYQRATNLAGTGWPYCAAFVDWVILQWGKNPEVLSALGMDAAKFEKWRPKTAAAYGFHEWAEEKGLLIIDENKNPGETVLHTGDIVTFDFSHIGIIDTDKGNVLYTIEGNTDAAGSRDGGGVYEKTRARSLARKIIRILP